MGPEGEKEQETREKGMQLILEHRTYYYEPLCPFLHKAVSTASQRSSYPFYIVTYHLKWVTTS